jgi:two-component system, NtrC family, response regulator HydG
MAAEKRILIAEDDTSTRQAWKELLGSWGFGVAAAVDGQEALDIAADFEPHIVLLDLKMPRKDGLEVLAGLRERGSDAIAIVISGEGDLPEAVKAVKLGAYDYLRKPIDPPHLRVLLNNLTQHLEVSEENRRLRRRLMGAGELGPLIGQSLAMRRVMSQIEQVAPSSSCVIITGESGTGKELVARTLHDLSPRRAAPYVAVNCAAIPETLMESELFGHERGAFTGADRRRLGCFEMANGGTLLLDEVTEMRVELQAKLLRVLEERKMRRLGGSVEIPLDVRVLAASNRSLESAIRERKLREDLYYRLNVYMIAIPPLRERFDDVPPLVEHFIRQLGEGGARRVSGCDDECIEALKRHPWPGNVRQLRNVIERALLVGEGPLLTARDLPPEFQALGAQEMSFKIRLGSSMDDVERELLYRTLEFAGNNKSKAAEILGISLKTLYNRLERYNGDNGDDAANDDAS